MEYGLIGEHLPHSFSKDIHEQLAPYTYELCELKAEELGEFLKKREFKGINVTIPYKQAVIPYLDEIDEKAKAIGAVNTVVNRGGRLCGYNTDYDGMAGLISRLGVDLAGKEVLIFGTGGTSRTAAAVARDMGAKSVTRVSRTAKDGAISYEQAAAKNAQFIVNTTPAGMFPHAEGQAMDISGFAQLEGLIDAVYNPLRTKLVQSALAMGAKADGGLYMLVGQAVSACELFLGKALAADTTARVYEKILAGKENVVLTGMPGSGKSTVGGLLAAATGRELVDTDAEIVRAAGMPITEIFATRGEKAFRDLESEVIAEISARTGIVIATGGGAILREENVRRLKQNGRVFFLDRALADILPTDDRPLSSDREALERRFAERYPTYCATADVRIAVTGTAEEGAKSIQKECSL